MIEDIDGNILYEFNETKENLSEIDELDNLTKFLIDSGVQPFLGGSTKETSNLTPLFINFSNSWDASPFIISTL